MDGTPSDESSASCFAPLPYADDHIRLLKSSGDEDPTTLRYDVSVHDLSRSPPFKAVSYTWGDLSAAKVIVKVGGKDVLVRPNCWAALAQAHDHYPDAYIWIDSVCIDQTNIQEKNRQVQIMGDIFARASTVLVCLGPHTSDSRWLFDTWARSEHDALFNVNQTSQDTGWLDALAQLDETQFQRALHEIAVQKYWSRVWIIQELAMSQSREVLCGEHRLPWARLERLVHSPLVQSIEHTPLARVVRSYWKHANLIETVLAFEQNECEDPRDHVYAVLSLSKRNNSKTQYSHSYNVAMSTFEVDYNEPPASLALRVASRGTRRSINSREIMSNQERLRGFIRLLLIVGGRDGIEQAINDRCLSLRSRLEVADDTRGLEGHSMRKPAKRKLQEAAVQGRHNHTSMPSRGRWLSSTCLKDVSTRFSTDVLPQLLIEKGSLTRATSSFQSQLMTTTGYRNASELLRMLHEDSYDQSNCTEELLPQWLNLGSDVCGILCPNAKSGDRLVPAVLFAASLREGRLFPERSLEGHVVFVVRPGSLGKHVDPSGHDLEHKIVGQGIVFKKPTLQAYKTRPDLFALDQSERYEVQVTLEDLVALTIHWEWLCESPTWPALCKLLRTSVTGDTNSSYLVQPPDLDLVPHLLGASASSSQDPYRTQSSGKSSAPRTNDITAFFTAGEAVSSTGYRPHCNWQDSD